MSTIFCGFDPVFMVLNNPDESNSEVNCTFIQYNKITQVMVVSNSDTLVYRRRWGGGSVGSFPPFGLVRFAEIYILYVIA